ncbi:MAG TPA: NAD(P)H-dependent glycerol-3-phosphate dehydrogenase, partial [Bradyrhizobium sp.]|nr:NAD(P)H-dependent glycerol-3-phosphate dehydrogenase [Bradyrhizobium sp.]
MSRIAIIGSGAWGTALAISLSGRKHSIALWSHTAEVAETIARHRENRKYLPGYTVPEAAEPTADLATAVAGAEIVIGVMPSACVHEIYSAMAPHLAANQLLVSATKGIIRNGSDPATYRRVTEVIAAALAGQKLMCAALSGPSFAEEVAAGQPTAMTVACTDTKIAAHLQEELSGPALRLYTNDDVVGVELGGALKNVIAIATGIVDGLGLGHNSAAALITRGIAEITRLAVACGARRETMAGLAGLGDLVLTCTGDLSRNRRLGLALGRGVSLDEAVRQIGQVVES